MKCIEIIGISALVVLVIHTMLGNVGSNFLQSPGLSTEIIDSYNSKLKQ